MSFVCMYLRTDFGCYKGRGFSDELKSKFNIPLSDLWMMMGRCRKSKHKEMFSYEHVRVSFFLDLKKHNP